MKRTPSPLPEMRTLRHRAEQRLGKRHSPAGPPKSETEIRALVHELQAHQIELEMQNEELRRAQTEAQQVAEKYTALFDFAPVAYFVLDRHGIIREVNLAGAALLGLDRHLVTRQLFEQFVAFECRSEFRAFWRSVRPGEGRRSSEVRLRRHGHGPCAASIEACRAEAGGGSDEHCWLTVTDLTEKRAGESLKSLNAELEQRIQERTATLRESEERFRSFATASFEGIIISEQGRCVDLNDQMAQIMGRPREELIGLTLADFLPSESREQVLDNIRAGREGMIEREIVRGDGSRVFVQAHGRTIVNQGRSMRLTAVRDLTERRRAEEALREMHEFNLQIITSARQGIIVLDREGRHLVWNRFMEVLTGCPAAEALRGLPLELFPFLRNYDFDRLFQRALAGEVLKSPDMLYENHRLGRKMWVVAHLSPLHDPSRAIIGALVLVDEITERKRLERQLLESSESEQERIGQDLHDGLSQQLTGIVLLNSSLREDLLSKALPEAADAQRIGELLIQTQRDLRQVARGLHPVADVPEGLRIALAELAKHVSDRGGIACRFECNERVLVADNGLSTHLFRIAQEAVNNALRHGHPKHVSVTLTEENGMLVLAVENDGRALRTPRGPKLGLGLRIMRSRCEAMSGKIEIRPTQPRGTLVRCTVPLPRPTQKEAHP